MEFCFSTARLGSGHPSCLALDPRVSGSADASSAVVANGEGAAATLEPFPSVSVCNDPPNAWPFGPISVLERKYKTLNAGGMTSARRSGSTFCAQRQESVEKLLFRFGPGLAFRLCEFELLVLGLGLGCI